MGHPKKQKRKYSKPKLPYQKERLDKERKIREMFGLKRKKEIWKMNDKLREFRRRARKMQAEDNKKGEKELLDKLKKTGILDKKDASLEDVLNLEIKDILKRRLQSLVFEKKLANTPKQARQLVVHKHVKVNDRVVDSPGYLVPKNEENTIECSQVIKNE